LAVTQNTKTRDELIDRLLHDIPALQSNRRLAVEIVDGCGGSVQGFVNCVANNIPFTCSGLRVSPSPRRNSRVPIK
jgi:hypothetical protein